MHTVEQRRELNVEDIMTQELIAVGPTTSLAALQQLFLRHGIAGAPVIDEKGQPIGMVTSTDLIDPGRRSNKVGQPIYYRLWRGTVRMVGISDEGEAPARGVVGDVMTPALVTIDRRATLREAVQLMAQSDIHHLVVTEAGRARGVLTAMDCLKAMAGGTTA